MEDRGHRAIRLKSIETPITMGGIMIRRVMGNHEINNGSSRLGPRNSNIRVQDGRIMKVLGVVLPIQTMLRAPRSMRGMDGQNQRWKMQMYMITDRHKELINEIITLWIIEEGFKNSGRLERGNCLPIQMSQVTKAETTLMEDILTQSNSTNMLLCFRCKKCKNIEHHRKATWVKKMKIQHVFQAGLQIISVTI